MTDHSEDAARHGIGGNNPPVTTLADRLKEEQAEALRALDAVAERANKAPKEVASEDDVKTWTDVAADAHDLLTKLEASRVSDKQPFLDGGRDVDSFYREPKGRCERIENVGARLVKDFRKKQQAKADAERAAQEAVQRAAADAAKAEAERLANAGLTDDAMDELKTAAEANAAADDIAQTPAQPIAAPVETDSGAREQSRKVWKHEITDLAKVDLEAIRSCLKVEHIDAALRQFVRNNKGARQIAGVRIFEDDDVKLRR